MEKSETKQKTINLGKLLVKELELEQSVDTLGRWMAHHLATKITEVENAKGKAKDTIEKECADLILKIWSHRRKKTANAKSFHNFEQIFDTLTQLNPRKEKAFYFDEIRLQRNDTNQKEEWLSIATDVDKYARICIDFSLDLAVSKLTTEEQVEWLQNAPELTGDIDIKIMQSLIDKGEQPDFSDEANGYEAFSKKMSVEKLKSNIVFLENFRKLHSKILKELKRGLEEETK